MPRVFNHMSAFARCCLHTTHSLVTVPRLVYFQHTLRQSVDCVQRMSFSPVRQLATKKACGTNTACQAVVSGIEEHRIQHHATECDLSNGVSWLEGMPRGAYTTCRTVRGGTSVFELSFHLQRLVDSLELMMTGEDETLDALTLKEDVLWTIRDAVEGYRERECDADEEREMKITVLVPYERPISRVYTHVTDLGSRKPAGVPVKVEIRGEPRKNAAAKDSDWVLERKKLGKSDDVNEIVLEQGGLLYEGLSSNFFAMKDGVLYTAGEGILLGSVRESVLRMAEELDIPIVLEPPHVDDMEKWDAAFISSTSRMLLPIDVLAVCRDATGGQEEGHMRNFDNDAMPIVGALEKAVMEDILSSSESIFMTESTN